MTHLQPCVGCGRLTPAYYLSQGYCDDCKWNTWIPDGYERREAYRPSALWGHLNATRRPLLGASFLDDTRRMSGHLLAGCRRAPKSGAWAPREDTSETGR